MKIKREDLIKPETSKLELSDGMYSSAIVGYMVSERTPFNDPDGAPYNAVRFCFQLEDDSGNIKCVQSPDYRISFSEKSTFFKMLSSWSKAASADQLWQRMEDAGFIEGDEFNLDKFLGMHLSLMTTLKASKKDASKMFPEFTWTPSKKGQLFEVKTEEGKEIPLWLPSFIEDDKIIETKALEGFVWKRFEERSDEPEATIGKSSRKQTEPEEGIPAENVKQPLTQTSNPKLKVRTRKTEEEIDF
jgi:hypothetical protein